MNPRLLIALSAGLLAGCNYTRVQYHDAVVENTRLFWMTESYKITWTNQVTVDVNNSHADGNSMSQVVEAAIKAAK